MIVGTNFLVTNSIVGSQKLYRLSRLPAPYVLPLPVLTIERVSLSSVRLLWSAEDPTFSLQSNTNLATTNWVTVAPPPMILETNNVVTNTITGSAKFYRLFKP